MTLLRIVNRRSGFTTFQDRRERPIYSVAEAAKYLGIPNSTLASWIPTLEQPALLRHVDPWVRDLSFFDLIEAHILRAARERRVPRSRILRGLNYLIKHRPHTPRPLLTMDFYTHGKDLLVRGMFGLEDEALVNASRSGQLEVEEVIKEHLHLIERDQKGLPMRVFPKPGQGKVSLTVDVVSGRPVIDGTRIPTSIIAQRFRAGETMEELAAQYKLAKEWIETAITYERAAA